MKIQKTAGIALIVTAFLLVMGNLPSQAQINIYYSPESLNNSNVSRSANLLALMATKQNLKLKRVAMDEILGLTNEQVIKKNALFLQFNNEINAVTTELADGIGNRQTRAVTVAISNERKTAISKKLFAGVRNIMTPKQLQNDKAQKFLALYENFLLQLAQTP
jgi:hypothetical protein